MDVRSSPPHVLGPEFWAEWAGVCLALAYARDRFPRVASWEEGSMEEPSFEEENPTDEGNVGSETVT